jgi:glycosyltransferase involved in cell wall biosynthesis
MIGSKKIVVVMPAYNAENTLLKTHQEVIEQEIVDLVIIVDDGSSDQTAEIARTLDRTILEIHSDNRGYGANQKSCYRLALKHEADIVIMVHPDYQYTPKLIPAMASMINSGLHECVLASRILGGGALKGGMPLYKYISNRILTLFQNLLMGAKLSEYHTGYRAFTGKLLKTLPLDSYSDDFIFDNQVLAGILWQGHQIAEITCPTKYFKEASSINFIRSFKYGLGCIWIALLYRLGRTGLFRHRLFKT